MEKITMIPTAVDAALASATDIVGGAAGVFLGRDRTPVFGQKSAFVPDPRPAGPLV